MHTKEVTQQYFKQTVKILTMMECRKLLNYRERIFAFIPQRTSVVLSWSGPHTMLVYKSCIKAGFLL